MTFAAGRYLFEGQLVSAKELAKAMPAYGEKWLRLALQDGCASKADIVRRQQQSLLKSRAGGLKGARRSYWDAQRDAPRPAG